MKPLHRFVFSAIALLCAHAATAQSNMPPVVPPNPMTAAVIAEQYGNKSFDDLMKMEDFSAAYRAALGKSPLSRAAWPFKDAGWPASTVVDGPHNRKVVMTGTCSTRKCDLNRVQAFFDPISKKMYAHLTLGNKAAWLGKTDTFEQRMLNPLLQ
jgi:hypothetical protein